MRETIRIIGIDPGLQRTGWGIIESLGNALRFVAAGTVRSDNKAALASRLCQLHDGLADVLHREMPHEAAVEATFVNKDATATLKLGQARGIAMLVPARAGLVGRRVRAERGEEGGRRRRPRRTRSRSRMMVKVLLPKSVFDSDDAADALAIAICHAHHRQSPAYRLAALAAAHA
jgi:crossover junction endodeoxyribonuclease RuvC